MLIPLLILGGIAALAIEHNKTKEANAANAGPAQLPPGPPPPPPPAAGTGIIIPLAPANTAPVPPMTPVPVSPATGQQVSPSSAEGNALAAAMQPQPPNQPPLPPSPPPSALPPGTQAIVATNGDPNTNDARLRIRSQPNTTAAPVPGGEPSVGGGAPKGATVNITGPLVAGFAPISYNGLVGYAWAAYLKDTSGVAIHGDPGGGWVKAPGFAGEGMMG